MRQELDRRLIGQKGLDLLRGVAPDGQRLGAYHVDLGLKLLDGLPAGKLVEEDRRHDQPEQEARGQDEVEFELQTHDPIPLKPGSWMTLRPQTITRETGRNMYRNACSYNSIVANSSATDAGTLRFACPALARVLALAATLTLLTLGSMQHALAGGRVAMVLAAEEYANFKPSDVGVKRGEDLAELLRARGFQTFVVTNPANAAARATLRDFAAKTPVPTWRLRSDRSRPVERRADLLSSD